MSAAPGVAGIPSDGFNPSYARELVRAGRPDDAVRYIHSFIAQGNAAAMVAMADYEFNHGSKSASEEWIARVERLVACGDADAAVDLVSAYELGLGGGSQTDRDRKALQILEYIAEAGNVVAAHSLMSRYLYGLNGAAVSREKFVRWAKKAAEYGSEGAAKALRRIHRWPRVAPGDE